MVLRRKRNSKSGAASAVLMTVLLAVVVFSIGTSAFAKEKVATISAHLVTLEKVDKIFGVYPNELNVANGDVIKITNESGVTVELKVPGNLFVNDNNVPIAQGTVITIDPGGTRILNVYEDANATTKEVPHTLEILFDPVTEKVQARPRIIVQPPSS